MTFTQRSARIVVITMIAYVSLVASHLGEFWPFSIYPMFSSAGRPWSRAVVRSLPAGMTAADLDWTPSALEDLPGHAFAAEFEGIEAIDLANYVSKTERWTDDRVAGLHRMFAEDLEGRSLLVMRVDSVLEGDAIGVRFVPYVLITAEGAMLNPELEAAP